MYLQGEAYKGGFKVYLEDKDGNVNSNVLTFTGIPDDWKKYEGTLKALNSADSRLCIVADAPVSSTSISSLCFLKRHSSGTMERTALPQGSHAGARRPQTHIHAFPGGCASEGPNYFGQVFWKNSIGSPEEDRIP